MSALLRRLKLPFRRRNRQNTYTKTSPTHQSNGSPQPADEGNSNSIRQPHRIRSPSPLPVITDSGPPAAHRYENEDIFWNSTMIEADRDPEKNQARSRGQTRRSASQDSLHAVGPDAGGYGRSPGPESVRAEVKHNPPNTHHNAGSGTQQRLKASSNPARKDTDIIAMLASFPEPPSSSPRSPIPQKPIIPSTEEWDAFMDFPSDYSMNIYSDACGNQCVVLPKHTNGETIATAIPTNMNGSRPSPPSATRPHYIPNGALEPSSREVELTWNLALHHILEHDCVDPVSKQIIRERTRGNEGTYGNGNCDHTIISVVGAGLVPNFSYPISGSEFYDRVPVEHLKHHSLNNGMTDCNGDVEKQETNARLSNGVKPHDTSSKCSTESDLDESDHASTLSSEHPDRVFFLLSSQLTPSELSLHHRILNIIPPSNSPPFPSTTPPSNASSSTPRHERLICKLHDTIKGLQDRESGLEDCLIPQLCTWLERKSVIIENLKVDIAILNTETVNLKRTIDFGNRVLGGCWEREGELWHILNELRKKRSRGLLRRLARRSRDVQDGTTSNASTSGVFDQCRCNGAAETGVQHSPISDSTTPRTTTSNTALSKREFDALIDIATQNIRILKEDIDEMIALVQGCKTMAERVREIDAVEGSYRDV